MSEIDSVLKEANRSLYPFYQHVKRHIPEMIVYTVSEDWLNNYSDSNIGSNSNKEIIVFLPFADSFFVAGRAREKFFSPKIFSYFKNNGRDVDKFLKVFNIILNSINSNAFIEFNIEHKKFFFMADVPSFSRQRAYSIEGEDREGFFKSKGFELTYKHILIKELNEIIEPIINKTVEDIDELTSEDLLLLEMISV